MGKEGEEPTYKEMVEKLSGKIDEFIDMKKNKNSWNLYEEELRKLKEMPDEKIVEFYISYFNNDIQDWMEPLVRLIDVADAYESFYESLKYLMYDAIARLSKTEYSNLLIKVFNAAECGYDRSVMSDAIEALGNSGDPRILDFLGKVLEIYKRDGDNNVAYYAAKSLGKIKGEKAVDFLINSLRKDGRSYHEEVYYETKAAIAEAFGETGDKRAFEILTMLYEQDEFDHVRTAARKSIEKLRKIFPTKVQLKKLKDENPDVRIEAIKELVFLRDKDSQDSLIEALKDKSESVRKEAIIALINLDFRSAFNQIALLSNDSSELVRDTIQRYSQELEVKDRINILIEKLRSKSYDRYKKGHIIELLGILGDERAYTPLVEAMNNREMRREEVAKQAISVLQKYERISDSSSEEVIEKVKTEQHILLEKLTSLKSGIIEETEIKKDTGDSISKDELDDILVALEPDDWHARTLQKEPNRRAELIDDWNRRSKAIRRLKEVPNRRAVDKLLHFVKNEKDSTLKDEATEALGKIKDDRVIAYLLEILKDKDYSYEYGKPKPRRYLAAKALGELGVLEAVDTLLEVLKEPVSSNSPPVISKLKQEIIVALGKLGDPRCIEPLLSELKTNIRGSDGIYPLESLLHFQDKRVFDYFLEIFNDKDNMFRHKVVPYLVNHEDSRGKQALIKARNDPSVKCSITPFLSVEENREYYESLLNGFYDEDLRNGFYNRSLPSGVT